MTVVLDETEAARVTPRRLSEVLGDLEQGLGSRIRFGDLTSRLQDRSYAPLMVLFAVPNVFLYLPGSSKLNGLPLMIVALQLIAGRPSVWLPRIDNERSGLERPRYSIAASVRPASCLRCCCSCRYPLRTEFLRSRSSRSALPSASETGSGCLWASQ